MSTSTEQQPKTAEEFGPPAPHRLFIWRFHCPIHRQTQTLDTFATTREHAFERAVRYLRREHRRLAACGVTPRRNIRLPRHPSQLTLVMPAA